MTPSQDGDNLEDWTTKMKRTLIISLLLFSFWHHSMAQYVTMNHDETKMNQITIMETGEGSLTPPLFYSLLHGKYKSDAQKTNKLSFREEASAAGFLQTPMANSIDTSLQNRARIEALNMADREIDLAWQTEGGKIESLIASYKKNLDRILLVGGTPNQKAMWNEYLLLQETAIKVTKDAYMPNSKRKMQYIEIAKDIKQRNNLLINFILALDRKRKTENLLNARTEIINQNGIIAYQAAERWRK